LSGEAFDTAEKAARLVSFALRPRVLPMDDADYAELIHEFMADASSMQMLERVVRGLRLRVLELNIRAGLILGTTDESPFELHRDDYHARMSASDRIVQGLIHLAIAAWCYPRAEDLGEADDVLPARLTVEGLVTYVHGLCEELKGREEKNIALPSAELRTGWQHVLALGKYADSADGRSSFATLAGKVRYALNFLASHGLMRRDAVGGRESWLARPAFRIHVRELAGHEAYAIVSNAAQEAVNG
jgi:hypothetical protein